MDEKKEKLNNNNKNILITVIVGLACLGAGFYGGTLFQKNQRTSFTRFATGGVTGMNRTGTSRVGSTTGIRPINGQILSIDSGSITVKTQNGNVIVMLSGSTKISKSSEGSTSDLQVGQDVTAIGTDNNGVITATSVSIGTTGFQFQGGGNQPSKGN